jgi:hypothetical protein
VAAALITRVPGDPSSDALLSAMADGGVAAALRLCGARAPQSVVDGIQAILPEVRERFGARGAGSPR